MYSDVIRNTQYLIHNTSMKILFTRFPLESRFGGAEVQTLALMKGLKERGHEVAFMGSCSTLLKKVAGCKLQIFELDIGIPPVSKVAAFTFLWRKLSMGKKIRSAICNLQLRSPPCPVMQHPRIQSNERQRQHFRSSTRGWQRSRRRTCGAPERRGG